MKTSTRTKQRLLMAIIPLSIVIVAVIIVRLAFVFINFLQSTSDKPINIIELWNNHDYQQILLVTEIALDRNPMDETSLAFAGFSSFYIAAYASEVEERYSYLDHAIFYLRRYLNLQAKKYAAEASYVLARAYYQKGENYASLVIKYLDAATEQGYTNSDIYEYYGLAYTQVGNDEKSIESFLKIHEGQRGSSFFYSLGEAYAAAKSYRESEYYYDRAIRITQDDNLKDQCYFKLSIIYILQKKYTEAIPILEDFLVRHPDNADAYQYLGDSYFALNNELKARVAWQQAIKLDHSKQEVIEHF